MTNRRKREKAKKKGLIARFLAMGLSKKAAEQAASKSVRKGRKTS